MSQPTDARRGTVGPPLGDRIAFVIDDEANARTTIATALTSIGMTVFEYADVAAMNLGLAVRRPDLIVLDLSLEKSDAIEAMRNLAEAHFGGALLLVTGHDQETLNQAEAVGRRRGLSLIGGLRKPFSMIELRNRAMEIARPPGEEPSDAIDLAAALQNDWLDLWYQPKIDLRSNLVCGAEALLRLRHPKHGVLLPAAFLPPTGDSLYRPITNFVIRRAMADWPHFSRHRLAITLAVNVPAAILQNPDFVANLRTHLPNSPDFPGLIVEITEDDAISNPDLAREIALQLKLYKVMVSIDDFGVGFSLLERLNDLPFAELKLDRSFVSGCASDARKQTMCEGVIRLARRFNVKTVAEGIDNNDDLAFLKKLGFDIGQGFLFAKAMPADDFVSLLLSRAVRR